MTNFALPLPVYQGRGRSAETFENAAGRQACGVFRGRLIPVVLWRDGLRAVRRNLRAFRGDSARVDRGPYGIGPSAERRAILLRRPFPSLTIRTMEILRAYSKSEDAWLTASLLRSRGIEAIVIDESAFGGNLLGVQKSAIRVEVEEEDLEEANRVIDEAAEAAEDDTSIEDEPVEPVISRSRWFDILVLIELASVLSFAIFPGAMLVDLGSEVADRLVETAYSEELWIVGYELYGPMLFLVCLASASLLLRWKIGRWLYAITASYSAASYLMFPAAMVSPLGSFVGAVGWALTGFVAAAMFLPPVSGEFRRLPSL